MEFPFFTRKTFASRFFTSSLMVEQLNELIGHVIILLKLKLEFASRKATFPKTKINKMCAKNSTFYRSSKKGIRKKLDQLMRV